MLVLYTIFSAMLESMETDDACITCLLRMSCFASDNTGQCTSYIVHICLYDKSWRFTLYKTVHIISHLYVILQHKQIFYKRNPKSNSLNLLDVWFRFMSPGFPHWPHLQRAAVQEGPTERPDQ